MNDNEQLQKDVRDAILWEPLLNDTEITVTADEGVVTLTGTVDSYVKKSEAEDAAKQVAGVLAVLVNIEIRLKGQAEKTDEEIAADIATAFYWNQLVPADKIRIRVEKGWVTLEGELFWNYEREAAEKSIGYLDGIKGLTNDLLIKSEAHDQVEKAAIEQALKRNWSINEHGIEVQVLGNKVTLTGHVHSVYQKDQAGRIAWNAPGVWTVENELTIVPVIQE